MVVQVVVDDDRLLLRLGCTEHRRLVAALPLVGGHFLSTVEPESYRRRRRCCEAHIRLVSLLARHRSAIARPTHRHSSGGGTRGEPVSSGRLVMAGSEYHVV